MKRNNIVLYVSEALLVIVFMSLFLMELNGDVGSTIESLAADRLEEASEQTNTTINLIMENATSEINLIAELVDGYNPDLSIDYTTSNEAYVSSINVDYRNIMDILNTSASNTFFSKLRFAFISSDETKNGWTIRSDAYSSFPNDIAINISNLDWFIDASNGNAGMSQVLVSSIDTTETFFTIYAPVRNNDGDIIGAVNGLVYPATFSDSLDLYSFGGKGFSHIIQKNGDIVYLSNNSAVRGSGSNFFDMHITGGSLSMDEIKTKIENDEDFFVNVPGYKRLMYFSKSSISDWYIITIVDSTVYYSQTSGIRRSLAYFTIEISLLFVVIGAITIINILAANRNKLIGLNEARLSNERSHIIIENSNLGYFEYDYATGQIELLKSNVDLFNSNIGIYILSSFVKNIEIDSEYRMDFLNLFDESKNNAVADILFRDGKWLKITVERLKNGHKAIGIVNDITSIKMHEEELIDKASLDSLTGIKNRISFLEYFNNTEKKHGCIAIIDIDEFKQINDNLGHQKGDEALIKLAKIIDNISGSISCRLGGDEFMMYFESDSNEYIVDVNNIIRSRIKDEIPFKINYSMGIVRMSDCNESFEELYSKADKALYEAKNSGKNQFKVYL